ncbi:MAG: membrane protein insertase YidC [Rickettsiales bacterium]|jgi:YidC/Oxa1 family membrane protein insertase|nr:membrane protein insertase YidC [Rickettsiales bacterium]
MVKILNNSPLAGGSKPKFLELALLLGIFLGLNWLIISFFMPSSKPQPAQINNDVIPRLDRGTSSAPIEIKSENIELTQTGDRISNVRLLKYHDGAKPVELLANPGEFIEFGLVGGGEFTKTISISEDYVISVRIKSKGNAAPYARIARDGGKKSSMMLMTSAGGLANIDGNTKRESWGNISDKSAVWGGGANSFVGFEDQYWQTLVQIDSGVPGPRTLRMKNIGGDRFQADISADAASDFTFNIYAGPKSQKILNAANPAMPGVAQTIDYGWFSFLSRPFLWSLTALHDLVGNYGLAIIILTLIIRILMIPLTKKSYKSMAAMQKMQPEMQRIQKLYKDDRARLQQEMMRLYQTTKVSPMSGCLPMLLQIPIFFALYRALIIAVEMRDSSFLWIRDLAAADPTNILNLFGLLPFAPPSFLPAIGILPILMGATMWLQMKMSSNANAATPGMGFMKWMPVVFVVLFAGLPAGLVLYWTVSNIFGIAQQYYIKKSLR